MEKSPRETFGEELLQLAREDERIVGLSADLEDSTKAQLMEKQYPERFFNVGIAEQDMIGIASGLAAEGFIPFASSFASFMTMRAYDMIRMSICYNHNPVKLVATHAGLTVGEDGGSAQCLEDIAVMRVLPGMEVFVPADSEETRAVVRYAAYSGKPCYIRLPRENEPDIFEKAEFVPGKGNVLKEGTSLTIITCGDMVHRVLEAVKDVDEIRVVNMSSIKPIDKELIIESAKKTGKIMTVEDHQISGGLGGAVAEILSQNCQVPLKIVGVEDSFGESGKAEELLKKHKLDSQSLAERISSFKKEKID